MGESCCKPRESESRILVPNHHAQLFYTIRLNHAEFAELVFCKWEQLNTSKFIWSSHRSSLTFKNNHHVQPNVVGTALNFESKRSRFKSKHKILLAEQFWANIYHLWALYSYIKFSNSIIYPHGIVMRSNTIMYLKVVCKWLILLLA